MSSMVMYRSNSDHNVVCRDIWFRIKRNLGPFLSLLGPFWQVLRSLKFLIFVNILVAALQVISRRLGSLWVCQTPGECICTLVPARTGYWTVMAGIAKSTTTSAHMTISTVGSHRPNQAITYLLKRDAAGLTEGSMDPSSHRLARAVHLNQQAGYVHTGSPHPCCKP